MKGLLYILLLFYSISFFSQTEKKTFLLEVRGKGFGFFIIEDQFFLTATLGLSATFYEKHSVGVDGTWFRWRREQEIIDAVPVSQAYTLRKYLYFDYKYHFISSDYKLNYYFNTYYKKGKFNTWRTGDYESYYNGLKNIEKDSKGGFNEFGIGIGIKTPVKDRFGFDLSANYGRHFRILDVNKFDENQILHLHQDVKTNKHIFYMRLNLFFVLIK